jgi:hypothetical protein
MSCNAQGKYYLNATSDLLLEESFHTRLILETPPGAACHRSDRS